MVELGEYRRVEGGVQEERKACRFLFAGCAVECYGCFVEPMLAPMDGTAMIQESEVIDTVLKHFPQVQAIYLYGSLGTEFERLESDADMALLLPPARAKAEGSLVLSSLAVDLSRLFRRDVDLVNLRRVPTVLQKEIVTSGRRAYTADAFAAEEFEMLTLAYYLKLNEERRDLVAAGMKEGRFFDV